MPRAYLLTRAKPTWARSGPKMYPVRHRGWIPAGGGDPRQYGTYPAGERGRRLPPESRTAPSICCWPRRNALMWSSTSTVFGRHQLHSLQRRAAPFPGEIRGTTTSLAIPIRRPLGGAPPRAGPRSEHADADEDHRHHPVRAMPIPTRLGLRNSTCALADNFGGKATGPCSTDGPDSVHRAPAFGALVL